MQPSNISKIWELSCYLFAKGLCKCNYHLKTRWSLTQYMPLTLYANTSVQLHKSTAKISPCIYASIVHLLPVRAWMKHNIP